MLSVSTQIARGDDLSVFANMLESVTFADEVIIFNMECPEKDIETLAKKYHAKVVAIKTPKIVEAIRSEQVKAASGDWVLIMDYDEIIPENLRDEIKMICESPGASGAYAIPRENFSLGYRLKHGGWERDYVVRLIHRPRFVMWPTNIHSTPQVKGGITRTTQVMEHHKDGSLAQMVSKTNRYSDIEATQFFAGHLRPVNSLILLRKWWMETIRRGVRKAGMLDGSIGLIQSMYQGFSVFISYAKLYEKQKGDK